MQPGRVLDDWTQTATAVVTDPSTFFADLSVDGFADATRFLAITHIVILALQLLGGLAMLESLRLPPLLAGVPLEMLLVVAVVGSGVFLAVFLAVTLGTVLLTAAGFHMIYYLLGAEEGFDATYAVFAYAATVQVPVALLQVLTPLLGGSLSAVLAGISVFLTLYIVYVSLIGVVRLHGLSLIRAAAPYLVLLAVFLAGIAAIAAAETVLGQAGMQMLPELLAA